MFIYSIGYRFFKQCRIPEPTDVWSVVFLCCLANFINAADRVLMPIAIIPMSDDYGWDLHQHGWVLSAFSIIGGGVAKHFGGSLVLIFSVLLWSVSSLVTPLFAFSTSLLIGVRFIFGIGEGIGLPTIFHIFSLVVPVEERSRALGYLVASGSIGQTFVTLFCPHVYWSISFLLFGVAGLVWIALWLMVYLNVRRVEIANKELGQNLFQKPYYSSHWFTFISCWPLWSIYIAHFCMNWSNYIIMQWLPTYLVRFLNASQSSVMFTAVPYLANCVASIVAGHLADNLIRKQYNILFVRRLMTFIGLIGPGLALFLFSASSDVSTAIFFISLSMFLSAFNSAGHMSNHVEVAPNYAGITFAVSNTLATIPGILCGPLTAHLVVYSSGRWFPVFILAGFMNLVGAIIYCSQSAAVPVL